ncbi:ATP-binding cassette sub-family A member 2 [Trichonephila clavipes]|nr:ATP-binding cassette sub-family A member 2 [Trichonephila clavipes]
MLNRVFQPNNHSRELIVGIVHLWVRVLVPFKTRRVERLLYIKFSDAQNLFVDCEARFQTYPLPSAGVIAVMQAFCDNGVRDDDGFINFPNSPITEFLSKLNNISQKNNFFQPDFAPNEMDEIPVIYKSIIEDPVAVHDSFIKAADMLDWRQIWGYSRPRKVSNSVEKVLRHPCHVRPSIVLLKNGSWGAVT